MDQQSWVSVAIDIDTFTVCIRVVNLPNVWVSKSYRIAVVKLRIMITESNECTPNIIIISMLCQCFYRLISVYRGYEGVIVITVALF